MHRNIVSLVCALAVAGCNSSPSAVQPHDEKVENATRVDVAAPQGALQPGTPKNIVNQILEPSTVDSGTGAPGTPGGLPDDRTPLAEPNGPIHYKSAEAAGQVAQRYGALLEQRKFKEARLLWSNDGEASNMTSAQFVAAFDKYATIHSEVGKPTDMEGAAGSSYITVPFRLSGTLRSGGRYNLIGPLTLRRVNDVPGSTDAQRHWHIQQSDLKSRS